MCQCWELTRLFNKDNARNKATSLLICQIQFICTSKSGIQPAALSRWNCSTMYQLTFDLHESVPSETFSGYAVSVLIFFGYRVYYLFIFKSTCEVMTKVLVIIRRLERNDLKGFRDKMNLLIISIVRMQSHKEANKIMAR